MIFIALLLFDIRFPFDTAVSVTMCLVGIFNIVAMCFVPGGVLPNLLLRNAAKDKSSATESSDTDLNDADEHDHLLPQTYGDFARKNQSISRSAGRANI